MLKLLKKEWIVNKTQLITVFITTLVLTVVIGSGESMPLWFGVLIASFYPFQQQWNEEQAKSGVLMNSLPVVRHAVVTAQYLSPLIIGLALILLLVGINAIGPFYTKVPVLHIVLGITYLGIYISVFYPIYHLLGPRFIQIGMLVLLALSITVFPIIFNLGLRNDFWGWGQILRDASLPMLAAALLTFTLLCLLVSRSISIRLYARKEF